MEEKFFKPADGGVFRTREAITAALVEKGVTDKYKIVIDGLGYVGVLKKLPAKKKVANKAKKSNRYIVHRSNVDPDNNSLPITVTANNLSSKKVFLPGSEVTLTESQLDVLRNSVEEVRLDIPVDSAIYSSPDPMALAQNMYPGMLPKTDESTGGIFVTKRTPNYIIESVV